MLERRRQWSFLNADENSWYWRMTCPDGTEETSEKTFSTLRACIEDATLNGYAFWSPEGERRADRKLPPAASAPRGTGLKKPGH